MRDALEQRLRKQLREETHLKLDAAVGGAGLDGGDGKPGEELLGLDPGKVRDDAVADLTPDGLLVVDEVGELDVARRRELHHELAILGEREARHRVRKEPLGEPKALERVVSVVSRGGEDGHEE